MKKIIIFLCVFVLIAGLMVGCGQQTSTKDSSDGGQEINPIQINAYVTQFGSIGYNHGLAIAEVVNKYNPKLKIQSIETLGISDSVKQIQEPTNKTKDIAYAGTGYRYPLKEGLPPLEKPAEYQALFVTMETGFTIMTNDPTIKTVYDLEGKRVNVGSPAAFGVFEKYLEALGLSLANTMKSGQAQGKDAIINGNIDASIGTWFKADKWGPSAAVNELLATEGGRLVSVPQDAMEKIRQSYPEAWYIEAPPESFGKWQTEPLGLFYQMNGFIVHPDFPEDLAYEIVKTVAEHSSEITEYHASLGVIADPKFLSNLKPELDFAEYHPGAIRYYKEAGLWVD